MAGKFMTDHDCRRQHWLGVFEPAFRASRTTAIVTNTLGLAEIEMMTASQADVRLDDHRILATAAPLI